MSLSKACVIAATNSQTEDGKTIDYIELASIAAERVRYYLGIPAFLLTQDILSETPRGFEGMITAIHAASSLRAMIAGDDTIRYRWHNDARIEAYKATENLADRILMIDADYMVASDRLRIWLESDIPFHIFNSAADITGRNSYQGLFPSNDIPMRWATAMCWSPGLESNVIFETARMVRDNYEFYALVLGLPRSPFRNDAAFSVACHLHNVPLVESPKLCNLPPDSFLYSDFKNHFPAVEYWKIMNQTAVTMWAGDLHLLNKRYATDTELMDQLRMRDVTA